MAGPAPRIDASAANALAPGQLPGPRQHPARRRQAGIRRLKPDGEASCGPAAALANG
jgi:hypothetical protein